MWDPVAPCHCSVLRYNRASSCNEHFAGHFFLLLSAVSSEVNQDTSSSASGQKKQKKNMVKAVSSFYA